MDHQMDHSDWRDRINRPFRSKLAKCGVAFGGLPFSLKVSFRSKLSEYFTLGRVGYIAFASVISPGITTFGNELEASLFGHPM